MSLSPSTEHGRRKHDASYTTKYVGCPPHLCFFGYTNSSKVIDVICALLKSASSKEKKSFLKIIKVCLSNRGSDRNLARGEWCDRVHGLPLPSGAAGTFWMRKIAQRDRQQSQSVGTTGTRSHEATNRDCMASRSEINEQEQVNKMAFNVACKEDTDGTQGSREEQSENTNIRTGVKNWRRFIHMIDALGTVLAMTASSGNTGT